MFFTFLNCTNGTKWLKVPHILVKAALTNSMVRQFVKVEVKHDRMITLLKPLINNYNR